MPSSGAKLMMIGAGFVVAAALMIWLGPRGSRFPGALKAKESYIDSEKLLPSDKSVNVVFARFEMENTGGRPVRIVKVESGCGCATPQVAPLLVGPGAHGVVDVEATRPPFGDKLVNISIYTDSPLTPKLNLRLRTTSARQPPYVATVHGDSTFNGSIKAGDSAEFVVTEIDVSELGREPSIKTSFPFLAPDLIRVEHETKPRPGLWVHTYHYDVRFTESPRSGTQSGVLTVIDPWDESHTETLRINMEQAAGLRVFPSTVTLNLKSDQDSISSAQFIVKRETGGSILDVRQAEAAGSQFVVEERGSSRDGAVVTMALRLKPGERAREGAYRMLVSADGQPDFVFPLTLTIGREP